jgi:group I intron endonuclease
VKSAPIISAVYKITNTANSKIYVGSSNNFISRKWQHFSSLKNGNHHSKPLQAGFNKYGHEAFVIEIIEECSKENLKHREQHYIDSLKPAYNCRKDAVRGCQPPTSEETKRKQSESRKGKSFHTEFQRRRISETQKGKVIPQSQLALISRKVDQIDLSTGVVIETYKSIEEAKRQTGANNIISAINGDQLKSGGFGWKYTFPSKEDIDRRAEKRLSVIVNRKAGCEKASITTGHPINQIDKATGEVIQSFDCARQAAKSLNKRPGSIRDSASGIQKTAYGFKWEYVSKQLKQT